MALTPGTRYAGQTDTDDPGYPLGKARNAGAFNDGTGTPLERDWLNDTWGFLQALLDAAEITASGDPDEVGASQYLDAVRAVAKLATNVRHARAGMQAYAIDLGGVTPPTDATLVALSRANTSTLLVKGNTNGGFGLGDTNVVSSSGINTTQSTPQAIASGGGRIVIVGNSGTNNSFSTNGGTAWTAGGALGLSSPGALVWDGTEFIAAAGAGTRHSTSAVAWTTPVVDVAVSASINSLAVLTPGTVLANDGLHVFVTTNHGASWAEASTIPSAIANAGRTRLVGNGSGEVLAIVCDPLGFDEAIECWATTDGVTWAQRTADIGVGFSSEFRAHMCQDTGLVVVASGTNPVRVVASLDRGRSWSSVALYFSVDADAVAVAKGRIFCASSTRIFATATLAG